MLLAEDSSCYSIKPFNPAIPSTPNSFKFIHTICFARVQCLFFLFLLVPYYLQKTILCLVSIRNTEATYKEKMVKPMLSEPVRSFVPLIFESSKFTQTVDATIKKIWALPESEPTSPCSVSRLGPTLDAEELSSFDESCSFDETFQQSLDNTLWTGVEDDIPSFIEAVQLMRPHERFRMSRLTGRFNAGQPYFVCSPSNAEERAPSYPSSGFQEYKDDICPSQYHLDMNVFDDGEAELFVEAYEAMLEWIDTQ